MPDNWDPQIYRERAQRWRNAARAIPPGDTRDACVALEEGYNNLAKLIEIDVASRSLVSAEPPALTIIMSRPRPLP
jgi:hypothetical protein